MFEGRMGRLSYATLGAFSVALLFLSALYVVKSPTNARLAMYVLFTLVLLCFTLRWTALRLHDLNRSGWWSVLLVLPYAGPLVGLTFALLPGSPDDNDHGPRPQGGHGSLFAAALAVLCVSTWLSLPTFLALADEDAIAGEGPVSDMASTPSQESAASPDGRSQAEGLAAFQVRYLAAREPKAFAVSAGGAWGMSDAAASADDAVTAAMVDCEVRRQPSAPPCRLINMNGHGSEP